MKAPRRDSQSVLEHQGRPARGRELYQETKNKQEAVAVGQVCAEKASTESSRLIGEKAWPPLETESRQVWLEPTSVKREAVPEEAGPETLNGSATLKSLPTSLKKSKHPLPDSVPAGQDDNLINVS